MSKVKALYHIVFCTKGRQMTLPTPYLEDLYRFIWKTITENKSRLLKVGGIENHVHILIELHPSVALADIVRSIKALSSAWMKSDSRFAIFAGWAMEYYASTLSTNDQNNVINYIKSQREHHNTTDFTNELKEMHRYANLEYDDRNMI